jgi:tRNA-uridine 2-sulfurtransferase
MDFGRVKPMGKMPMVVVGMSGGVDSSVAAALLVQQGYQVVGAMLRLWSEPGREGSNRCCTPDAMAQARRVANNLGIPFYALDVKDLFHTEVVEMFTAGYRQGITPNPCLACNRQIRWGYLLDHARAIGADYFATGHYARLKKLPDGRVQLREAVDSNKDQSYVLSILSQEQLVHTILPLGEMKKPEVRQLARDLGLAVAERAESQDLCFLGGVDYRLFLQAHTPEVVQPGEMVDRNGAVLGQHQGLAFYTIGQRKGLGISAAEPLYVVEKNLVENKLIVGTQNELGHMKLIARQANWIGELPKENPFRVQVKIRYKAQKAWGWITNLAADRFLIEFDQPLRDITPGQNAVVYQDDICLGSGIIEAAF